MAKVFLSYSREDAPAAKQLAECVRYNVACSLTFRNSDLEGALDLLVPYFERIDSPGQIRHAEIDPDMDSLRDNPRFKSMMDEAKQRLGMVQA